MRHLPVRIVIVNPVWDRRDKTPDDLLERFSTLTGWADAVSADDLAAGGGVQVVQRFSRQARVVRGRVTYHFVSHAIESAAAALGADVIHVNGFDRPLIIRRLRRAARTAAIAVQDHGGFDPMQVSPLRRAWLRFGLAEADALLVATPPQIDWFRRSGIVPERIAIRDVMESSTTLRLPDGARDAARPLSLLSVGRLNANKDPLTVIEGFARFLPARPDATLTFVYSSAELEPQLRARVERDAALRDRVRLAGRVPHAELPAFYAAADLFVAGSHHEGSGYAALEAIACGVVPVLTDIPSFRWLTSDGRLGALWQAGHAASLADALTRVASRPLPELRDACRRAFAAQWSWDAIGRRAAAIYRELSRA